MLPQASLLVNLKADTVLRIRAMITDEHIEYIIKKLAEMCNEESKATCSINDTFFLVPNGELVLRRCDYYNQGSLIYYKRYFQSRLNLPGSIDTYECVCFDLDLAYAIAAVLILSLNIGQQMNRKIYSFLLPNYTHIIVEPSPSNIGYILYIQVLLKSAQQNVNKNCNDATIIIKNLMHELSITEDDLIF